ncbi:MAG: GMC family oxidoreductase [Deltaproteobacteria bacterium]|nr:GMC family oxidoreductase [Deltaproteobacteria bacterium]
MRAIEEEGDFVIVGSGAAGATVARWLSAAGREVVIVEEGAPPRAASGAIDALGSLYRDAGTTAAIGQDVLPLLQGRCLGGTTVINGGIQVPFPQGVWQEWVDRDRRWAERLPWDALERARERMDLELGVAATPSELWGPSGGAMKRALGAGAEPTRRNTPGCHGSGRCLEGCPHGKKQSADVALIPRAQARGARVHTDCRIDRAVIRGGSAIGVRGRTRDGAPFFARARRAVILAAGAIQTAGLLLASGVRGSGRNFTCHPGSAMAGLFASQVIGPQEGTQSMQSLADLRHGFKLESLGMPRAFRAARVPGVGRTLAARLERLDHVALWGAAARAEARGRIVRSPFGPLVFYSLTRSDRRRLLAGLARLAEAMLDAGALEVWPAVHGAPERITRREDARAIAAIEPAAGAIPMVATHFFGGAVVDDLFQAGGVSGLVVADSALFPTNLGVNPMSSITAVATLVAERWAA